MTAARTCSTWIVGVVVAGTLAAGCGKKGPPLAPLRPVPMRTEDLTARRLGNDVFLQFTIPNKNADGTTPADLTQMEAYAITGEPVDPGGRALDAESFIKYGTPVAVLEVEPPPPPAPKEGPPPPPPPPDPRPAQAEKVTMAETLTAAAQTRFVHPKQAEFDKRLAKQPVPPPDWRPRIAPLTYPPYQPLVRVYVVAGRSKHDKAGGLSARLRVPLTEVPEPPSAPVITYNESKLMLEWTPPRNVHLRIQEPATAPPAPPVAPDPGAAGAAPAAPVPPPPSGAPAAPPAGASAASQPSTPPAPVPPSATPAGSAAPPSTPGAPSSPAAGVGTATTPTVGQTPAGAPAVPAAPVAPLATLNSRPTFAGVIPHTYNVYEYVAAPAGQVLTVPAPVNPAPLDKPSFDDPRLAFGTERCYVVRTVEAQGPVTVESLPSPPTCVTPRDTFAPAAPRNLAAVGSEGAVNLIWEPGTERDLGGYIVLRGVSPGNKLEALTPAPIKETTFRDPTAQPGVRYVYAVVAVDTAMPQNVSVESNRVEETAR